MSKTALQRLGIFLTFFFALACCASVPQSSETAGKAPSETQPRDSGLKLRLVYSADTKGNYQPCPT